MVLYVSSFFSLNSIFSKGMDNACRLTTLKYSSDAKFINVETGEIAFSVGVDGAREKFFDLKKTLANMIVEKLEH